MNMQESFLTTFCSLRSWRRALIVGFLLLVSLGCDGQRLSAEQERLIAIGQWPPDHKPGDLVPMGIGLLNYTDEEIDEVYVDRSWAANVPKHSSSTGTGSARTRAFYDQNYKINVRWRNETLFETDEKALFRVDLVPEPPQKDAIGRMTWLWIAFFPDGSVKIYPTWVSAGDRDFADGLKDPKDACLEARPSDSGSCYSNTGYALGPDVE